MPKYQFTKLLEVDARGGLSQESIKKTPGYASSGYTPTRSGRFIIHTIEKHVSGGRWIYSTIPWGTPMRVDADAVYVKLNGAWRKLSATDPRWLSDFKSFPKPELELRKSILNDYKNLAESYWPAVPDSWIFNDFGHVSVKYFRDINHNGVYDKKTDELMSDFIHTTPRDEASTVNINHYKQPDNINLAYSHGCIHVKPNDIDRLIRSGYVRRGIVIEVHPYSAHINAPLSYLSNAGTAPHELHFFPGKSTNMKNVDGKGKLIVYKVSKLS